MTFSSPKLLSIICPVMNEEEVIEMFLQGITPSLDQATALLPEGSTYEIIFIDDGSRDATPFIIGELAKTNPKLKLISLSRNFGKEAAMAAGLQYSSGDAAIPIDVDLQDPPEIIVDMVHEWMAGAKVVNAKRVNRDSDSWIKRSTAQLFYNGFNKIAHYTIPENVGDFRLLDREVVDTLNLFTERNRFMKAIFSWVGYKQATVEYTRLTRIAGTSKFKYWKLWNFALDGITGSTTVPLRMWTYVGVAMAIAAALFAAFIIVKTLVFGIDSPGYASLMVVMLTIGAFNFISLGILGEYVGRISEEVRNRPLFIVQHTVGLEEKKQPF
ncbi:MAG: glycosyltransferase [Micavibrio aeruginosavorus]|uniref:Glycosyltransferase n=1 Tax=Micavibrio aeruginosavorus TaxID=349221 RepID=A0A2W5FL02_9BACT|nr:MAG: glycosyltransferase [Micavibrio aeruginosavorus]